MKYYTLGIVLVFISLITISVSYYYTGLIRPLEKEIDIIELEINSLKSKIKINELEFAAHLNPEYLEKLEEIYFFEHYIQDANTKIIGIQEMNFDNLNNVVKVKSNHK